MSENSPVTPQSIRQALREVLCPGTKRDIVSIDLIGEVSVGDGVVSVQIRQTSEKPELIAQVRDLVTEKLSGTPGIRALQVEIHRAPGQAAPPPQAAPDPYADRARLPGVRNIVAVASAKGGVGKSSVAVNLALALRDMGYRTGLLDADIYGPSVPAMLGISEAPQVDASKMIIPLQSRGIQVISMGLLLPPNQPVVWRGPMVFAAVKQFLKDVKWHDLDYLVVDLPPGTGDAQLTLVQQVPLSGVVMVTTPQEIALADVRRGIQMFQGVKVPVLGVVENMSHFVCPGCGQSHDIFGSGGGRKVAAQFGVPFLGEIPFDPTVRQGGDAGVPAIENTDSPARAAFASLAQEVDNRVG